MSGTRRQRDSTAPSLFPFLAVLLCTMGSLVLILMLIVSGAQASAQQLADESRQRVEEVEAQIELAKSSYARQLREGQIELEKKRLVLQHFEEHILELLSELSELERTAQLLSEDNSTNDERLQEQSEAISELEKQLAEAIEELKQKVDQPDGDKPIFAIIPYQGSHGTHRRPIYLECVESGVILQPEGIRLSTEDLRPPYGPGNPLDAALRTIRAEYRPTNGAVTETAYPLLVVRPSGIRTYVLARAAMSGWDDQFGYELIAEDLELAFPSSTPGLSEKIATALRLARERQAALVMAMPRKYRQSAGSLGTESIGGGQGPGDGSNWGSGHSSDSPYSSTSTGRGGFANDSTSTGTSAQSASNLTGFGGSQGGSENRLATSGYGSSPMGLGAPAFPPTSSADAALVGTSDRPPNGAPSLNTDEPFESNASAGTEEGSYFGAGSASTGDVARYGDQASSMSASSSSRQASGGPSGGNAAGATGSQVAMPFRAPGQTAGSRQPTTNFTGNVSPDGQGRSSRASSNSSPSGPGSPSLNVNSPRQRPAQSAPVARARGRNWAWSVGPATQAMVVRSIHLHCFSDRWVLLPESGNPDDGLVITFEQSPRSRAEKLAKAVQDRVESWGLALAGGYWKPVVVVDVAPNAAWRFDQLRQLFEGSGLEIRLRSGAAP